MNQKTYQESIQAIIDLDKRPSKKEWNTIAGKYGYLNTISLSRLANKGFTQLCIDLKKRKNH